MKVLIIGNGGRESAIAWKLKNDPRITQFYFAKGNASTEKLGKTEEFEDDVKNIPVPYHNSRFNIQTGLIEIGRASCRERV